jgi:hypothetical protein
MERYIGLDVHAASCTVAVVSQAGRRLKDFPVETNGSALVEALRMIPGHRHLVFEEGLQSAWLYETLSPHVDEFVVAGVTRSRGPKSDRRDAYGLAEKLRTGSLDKQVFKAPRRFTLLRELSRIHLTLVRDVVRVQARLENLYRGSGISRGRNDDRKGSQTEVRRSRAGSLSLRGCGWRAGRGPEAASSGESGVELPVPRLGPGRAKRRRSGWKSQALQDCGRRLGGMNGGKNTKDAAALGALEDVDLEDPPHEIGPGDPAAASTGGGRTGGARLVALVRPCGGSNAVFPADGCSGRIATGRLADDLLHLSVRAGFAACRGDRLRLARRGQAS